MLINEVSQACEQLNAWIGGFQSMLNKMTTNNFDWCLHALLFLHTEKVIAVQIDRANRAESQW